MPPKTPTETDNSAMRDEVSTQIDRLESILESAKRDGKNGNWGTYDALLEEFNSVRTKLWEFRSYASWLGFVDEIKTVPRSERAMIGAGSEAEKAKYSEIITRVEPLIKRLKRTTTEIGQHADGPSPEHRAPESRTVFVAYGNNEKARIAMYSFLRTLGLFPLEWEHMCKLVGKSGYTNHDVVCAGIEAADAYVILLTPDETVRPVEDNQGGSSAESRHQARPNVLTELGQTWYKGRHRTVIVTMGGAHPGSNFAGIQEVRMNNSAQQRKRLVNSLRSSGCDVDDGGLDWLGPEAGGDFDGAVTLSAGASSDLNQDVDALVAGRREELVAAAIRAFDKWAGAGSTYSTELYREWICSGGLPDYGVFDYDMCGATTKVLDGRGRGPVRCPLKVEYDGDMEKGMRQHEYLVEDGKWPPNRNARSRP